MSEGRFNEAGAICLNIKNVLQIVSIVLPTEQSVKSFTFIFPGFYFNFKSTFTVFIAFTNNFWNEISKAPDDSCSY